jgi:hypothetical protein
MIMAPEDAIASAQLCDDEDDVLNEVSYSLSSQMAFKYSPKDIS